MSGNSQHNCTGPFSQRKSEIALHPLMRSVILNTLFHLLTAHSLFTQSALVPVISVVRRSDFPPTKSNGPVLLVHTSPSAWTSDRSQMYYEYLHILPSCYCRKCVCTHKKAGGCNPKVVMQRLSSHPDQPNLHSHSCQAMSNH
jgi:hypothetical protein